MTLPRTQAETLHLLACGFTRAQIARRRGRTTNTVMTTLGHLYRNLGAVNAPHAVALGWASGDPWFTRQSPIRLPDIAAIDVDILWWTAHGLDRAAIGRKVNLSVDAVKSRRKRLYDALGITTSAHAVHVAYSARLFPVLGAGHPE